MSKMNQKNSTNLRTGVAAYLLILAVCTFLFVIEPVWLTHYFLILIVVAGACLLAASGYISYAVAIRRKARNDDRHLVVGRILLSLALTMVGLGIVAGIAYFVALLRAS